MLSQLKKEQGHYGALQIVNPVPSLHPGEGRRNATQVAPEGGSHPASSHAKLMWQQRFSPQKMEQDLLQAAPWVGCPMVHNTEASSLQRTKQQPMLSFAEVYQNDRVGCWHILPYSWPGNSAYLYQALPPFRKCTYHQFPVYPQDKSHRSSNSSPI